MKLKQNFSTVTFAFFIAYFLVFYLRSQNQEENLVSLTTTLREQACSGIMGSDGQIVSSSERADTKSFINSLSGTNPSFGITEMLNNQTSLGPQQIGAIVQISGVWIVFLVLSVFGWLCYCLCCCCDSCCPPCKGCRRNLEEKPYKKSEVVVPGGFAILMSLVVIGTSIAGLVYAPGVQYGIRAMRCSFMAALEDVIAQSPNFVGIEGLQVKLNNLTSSLDSFMNSTTSLFSSNRSSDVVNKQQEAYNLIYNSPTVSNSYVFNQGLMTYILTGPSSSTNMDQLTTYYNSQVPSVDLLNLIVPNEYEIINLYFSGIISAIQGLESASTPFMQSSFADTINSGLNQTQSIVSQANSKADELYKQTDSMETYGQIVTQALQGLFGGSLFMAFLVVLGTFILGVSKAYKARILVHIGWCFFCLIMILGFILGAILNPVSIIAIEACEYVDQFLNNKIFFESNGIIKDAQMKSLFTECLFGQGDIMSNLGIKQQTADLQNITVQINSFQQTLANMTSFDVVSGQLQKNQQFTQGLVNGTYTDQADPSSATFNQNYWIPVNNQQQSIIIKNNEGTVTLQNYITDINNWISSITNIIDLVTNNSTGLFANIDCRILIPIFNGIYDGLCVLFVPAVYRTTILILLISVAMFVGSLASCCLGLRIGKYQTIGAEGTNVAKIFNVDGEQSKLNAQSEL